MDRAALDALHEATRVNRTRGEDAPGPVADRAEKLYQSLVPPNPGALDALAGRIALTVEEAAPAMGLSVRTVTQAIRNGDIPSMKLGGRRLIPLRALERHLEALAYMESGALDAWETAAARATVTRLGRSRRQAQQARVVLKRRAKQARRIAAELRDSPGAARDEALKIATQLAAVRRGLTVEEQLTTRIAADLLSDLDKLKADFGLSDEEVLDHGVE